eukprot:gnl/Spiro4/5754_TR2945_c0_g1_i1.p1 gnl/Spiro4/5754_TR2945_c0_g1~~gnl/Spiro4/5754_TR2945_c0_g1_i1.p1  ORF type:complete len:288 (+),score=-21.59 gnl/Spiro4/5754_TR2945_c0_g1_i1:490-1353(+)
METEQNNVIRLDTFQMSLQGHIADVQVKTFIDQCADLASSTQLPVQMSQTFGTPMKVSMSYPIRTRYAASFIVKEQLGKVQLVMDQGAISGEGYVVVNGHRLLAADFAPHFLYDHLNIGCDITSFVQVGLNEVSVEMEIEHDWDGLIDALYITGSFQVRVDEEKRLLLNRPVVQKLPLTAGPYEGHPYFAGTVSFKRSFNLRVLPETDRFELSFLNLDPQFHDVAEVIVNGRSLGVRAWLPYVFEGETSLLLDGENHIEVCVTNTLIGTLEGKYFDYAAHVLKPVFS